MKKSELIALLKAEEMEDMYAKYSKMKYQGGRSSAFD